MSLLRRTEQDLEQLHGNQKECTYEVAAHLLLSIHLAVRLIDPRTEAVRVAAEGDIEILEESIAACQKTFGFVCPSRNRRLAIEHDDTVCEVGCHDEIVLDHEGRRLGVHDEALDHTGCDYPLLRVKISAGLIYEVDICGKTKS